MLGQGTKAMAFLLAAGFCGGFCLSGSSAHIWLRQPSAAAEPDGAGGERGSIDTGHHGGGGQRGSIDTGHDGESAARAGGSSGGEEASAPREHAAVAKAASPAPAPTDLLSGNTLQIEQQGVTTVRYLSRSGWQAVETRPDTLLVRRWIRYSDELCSFMAGGRLACEGVTMQPASEPGPQVGAVLGTMTFATGEHWTVLRGNAASLPETIPLIDGRGAPHDKALPPKATLTGKAAIEDLVGRTLVSGGGKTAVVGTRFEPDGRWINAEPAEPGDATGLDGVRVSIGSWLSRNDVFCTDRPGLELTRTCFQTEQWGPGAFRLHGDHPAATITYRVASARP